MISLLVAAPASGSGKTTVTAALLELFRRRELNPVAFKSGPDYIDPMFHRAILGVESGNLDPFLQGEDTVKALFAGRAAGHGAALVESAMGYYDGLAFTPRASGWHTADLLKLPTLLVIQPKGASLTLAAQIRGLKEFRTPSHLAGILLNGCTPALAKALAPMLERETGLPVLGFLPNLPECSLGSRHLGLVTPVEIEDLQSRISALADALEVGLDWSKFEALFTRPNLPEPPAKAPAPARCRIAVARDEAFCFLYAEALWELERAGAEICFFSPLRGGALPEGIGGLYLPGGYPELHAEALSRNTTLRNEIRTKVAGGLPTVAECGGFLYLGQTLADPAGNPFPMAGVLPGSGANAGRLIRFGYAELTAEGDSLLFRAGETLPVHEFHHWDSTDCGADLVAAKLGIGRAWRCGFVTPTLYAAFPHLSFAGHPAPARRFADAAENYEKSHRV